MLKFHFNYLFIYFLFVLFNLLLNFKYLLHKFNHFIIINSLYIFYVKKKIYNQKYSKLFKMIFLI